MVERTLSLGEHFNLNDVRRLVEAAKEIGDNEQLVITLNNTEAYRAENVFSILERHDFECSTKGGHEGTDYYIIARKKENGRK
ncbi:MAG: hypothetical protein ACOZCL_12985 [Bacillota bacterium]